MKTVCYKYFAEHRSQRHQWRREQIEMDLKKNEVNKQKAKKTEEERQHAEKRGRDQEAQEAAANTMKAKLTSAPTGIAAQSSAMAASASTEPPMPTRPPPIPAGQQQHREEGEHTEYAIKANTQSTATTRQQQLPREAQQEDGSLLREDDTTGNDTKELHTVSPDDWLSQSYKEIKRFYDGFEICQWKTVATLLRLYNNFLPSATTTLQHSSKP
eukprot:6490294-Amphidinium_carterae.6